MNKCVIGTFNYFIQFGSLVQGVSTGGLRPLQWVTSKGSWDSLQGSEGKEEEEEPPKFCAWEGEGLISVVIISTIHHGRTNH